MWTWPRTLIAGAIVVVASAMAMASPDDPIARPDPGTPVAPPRLADTGLYADMRAGAIDPRHRAFSPQYPLWSDGATKRRWVYLPPGRTIDTSDDRAWVFPVGTRFWKEFSFGGRKVETRFMWRATRNRWVLASYRWNEAGTDATLASRDGMPGVADIGVDRQHSIPSTTDCLACHETTRISPLGFGALQLSTDRDAAAIHGEPLDPGMLTLETLAKEGRLREGSAPRRAPTNPRIVTSNPATRSVLGYLAANCGTCHTSAARIPLLGASLGSGDLQDGDAVVRAMLAHRTSWQRPAATAEGQTRLLDPAAPAASALLLRMRSRRPSSQMPPLGTVVADQEAIAAIAAWLATLQADR